MGGVELVLAFLGGVVMGVLSTALCSRCSSMRGSTDCVGMGDERRDDADKRQADVYSSARIGAAAALTLVLVVLLVGRDDQAADRRGTGRSWLQVPIMEPR